METLKTILYFSIFRYPLKLEEIHSYTNYEHLSDTENELTHLIHEKILTKVDDFYVYGSDLDSVIKRLRGNLYADRALKKARKKARFIAKFPFVKAVGVSGSLSKGYYDSGSDIDFFVITQPGKLWLCRTFLMLYKKIFLLNSRKYFCINYFVAANQLEIEEKNRFTATEMKTLIPMQGKAVFEDFFRKNIWVNDYFNKFKPNLSAVPNAKKPFFTKSVEFAFSNPIGNGVDMVFKRITIHKWKAKFRFMNDEDFKIALKSTRNISKHHPSHFQKKVILALNTKIEEVSDNYNINLAKEHV
ncbi:nucleotidyltransferase domain-containing protein [Flavobacterium sedimenticola]|uniref:Nucleotidyltransferase domain-containing protein n=1 Tax=Flavobacterium sedimenticola TaxID=3043286 RepID=A0ABT6XL85_9FLAO|nr:nucleotidyltransferase domain-containing protein [Flavobacterium sedimenticola]MDI9255831.1 nucleotidyltransferase domain-containing protein [Flavobacterium sedimenticola]